MPLIQQIYCKQENTCGVIPLEKRKVIKKTIGRTIGLFMVFCFFLVPFLFNAIFLIRSSYNRYSGYSDIGYFFVVLIISLVIFFSTYIFQCFYYRYYFYDLKNDEIVIRKGVISRNEITLSYSKIQNVYVDQDVLDRIFKLYDVHLETAGLGSGRSAHIDGVNEANMIKLRDILTGKVKGHTDSGV